MALIANLFGVGLIFALTIVFERMLKGELMLSIVIAISITLTTTLIPYWTIGIVLLLLALYVFQEFTGGEDSENFGELGSSRQKLRKRTVHTVKTDKVDKKGKFKTKKVKVKN